LFSFDCFIFIAFVLIIITIYIHTYIQPDHLIYTFRWWW